MTWLDFFSGFKDVSLAAAAVTTAFVAYKGLEKWKAELAGHANFEVARQFIRAVYRLRNELRDCRSPFVSASEFPDGYEGTRANYTAQQHGDAWFHVYKNRWQPVLEAVQDFDSTALEAEALWGAEIKEAASELRQLVVRLRVSMDTYIQNQYSGNQQIDDRDSYHRIRADLNASESERDTFSPAIKQAIENIENLLRPHLSRD